MKIQPDVTVIVICHNQEKYIEQAIESVLEQTWKPTMVLVIDDYSDDDSVNTIKSALSSTEINSKVLINSRNLGITKNRNIGINETNTELICFLDGDDYWNPNKLENELKYYIENPVDIVFSEFQVVDEVGTKIFGWRLNSNTTVDFSRIYKRDFPNTILFRNEIIRVSCLEGVMYDETLTLYEDFDIRLRLSQNFRFGYVNCLGAFYRQTGFSLSSKGCRDHIRNLICIYDKFDRYVEDLEDFESLKEWKVNYLGNLTNSCFHQRMGNFFGKLGYLYLLIKYPAYLKELLFG